jgi:prepilin-type N-terminal cleavage/methylation domain-containing protein
MPAVTPAAGVRGWRWRRGRHHWPGGFTLIEALFAVAIITTLAGIALPLTGRAVDELRTLAAARYLAGRIAHSRVDAIRRSTSVGMRFEPSDPDYVFTPYADGNGNGVRTADILRGVDRPTGVPRRLGDSFAGVRFGLAPGLPDVDGSAGGGTDGVRIGAVRILTMTPDGTATSGTLYVQGSRAQFAVRVLGATGRTRVFKYETGAGTWISR